MADKYKVQRTTSKNIVGVEAESVKITNTETGKSATSSKWSYQDKDLLQEAKDKLRSNE